MSNITIERKNGYWEAINAWNTYRSVNGHDWVRVDGKDIEKHRLDELRSAFFAHLDNTAEPQRAKVGEWVKSIHYPERDAFKVEVCTEYTVANNRFGIKHGHYTIVPEPVPAPEPKTYTGPAKDWGEGSYTNGDGDVVVIVNTYGRSFGVSKTGILIPSNWKYTGKYHRISTAHRPAIKVMFEAVKGGSTND